MRSPPKVCRSGRSRASLVPSLLMLASCLEGAPVTVDEDPLLARVAGKPIHASEVHAEIAFQIYRRKVDIYTLLKRETQRLVEEQLLASEAAARGATPEELWREAEGDLAPIGDAEIEAYLSEHPTDLPLERVRPRIRHYLEETRREERRLAHLRRLRERAGVEILLTPPLPPRAFVDLTGAPVRGPSDAPVTVVHFAALTSQDSARSARNLEKLRREFGDRLRIVHRHYPLERDELGLRAAQLAVAAQASGLFWELHDRLFALEEPVDESTLAEMASEFGLADTYEALSGDRETLLAVKRDIDSANRAGVGREPTLFVNGRYFMGLYSYTRLRQLVVEELGVRDTGR